MKYMVRNKNTKKIIIMDEAQLTLMKGLFSEKYLFENDWDIKDLEGDILDCTNYIGINK